MIELLEKFQLTIFLLMLLSVGAIATAYFSYELYWAQQKSFQVLKKISSFFLPSIIISPLIIVIFYKTFSQSLIFPPSFGLSFIDILGYCLLPSFVLFVSSGLFSEVVGLTEREIEYWSEKCFYKTQQGFGVSPQRSMRRLCLLKVLTESFDKYLVWVMAELIVVESLFNAPGAGYHIWQLSKLRALDELTLMLLVLLGLYGLLYYGNTFCMKWLGDKLESYA